MATEPLSPITSSSSSTKTRPGSRHTGFPEPLCGQRNTTLPHPEADLSPNATLSFDDIDPERALQRTRMSFLSKKQRTLSHGKIADGDNPLNLVDTRQSAHTDPEGAKEATAGLSGLRDSLPAHEPSARARVHRKTRSMFKFWSSK